MISREVISRKTTSIPGIFVSSFPAVGGPVVFADFLDKESAMSWAQGVFPEGGWMYVPIYSASDNKLDY